MRHTRDNATVATGVSSYAKLSTASVAQSWILDGYDANSHDRFDDTDEEGGWEMPAGERLDDEYMKGWLETAG